MSEQTDHRPRGRSPSYPAIDLEQAVERVRQLAKAEQHRHPVPIQQVFHHWGYKSAAGNANLVIAALKKFGLIEYEGSKDSRRAKLTALAYQAVDHPDPDERRAALQAAALLPQIHRELWEKFGATVPPDGTLQWELEHERRFTRTGALEFIPEYRATLAYAGLLDGGTFKPQDDDTTREVDDEFEDSDDEDELPPRRQQPRQRRMSTGTATAYTVPLVGPDVVIEGEFPISERDWEQLLAFLNVMKPGLVAANQDDED